MSGLRNTEKQKVLLQSDKRTFGTSDLAVLWSVSNRNSLLKTIERYVDRGILFRIYKGLYSTLPLNKLEDYEIACAIGGPFSYVSAETILSKNGIILQDIKKITLFGKKEKEIRVNNKTYLCRYLNDKFLLNRLGIEDKKDHAVATTERALADIRYVNPKFFVDNELSLDQEKVNTLARKIGYYDNTGQERH